VQRLRHVSQDVLAFLQPFVYSFTWRTAALRPPLDLSFLAACIACFAGGRLLGPVVNFDLDVYRERAWACDYGRGREFDLDLRVQGRDGCKRISVVWYGMMRANLLGFRGEQARNRGAHGFSRRCKE
jgi:hypothetical protein